MDQTELNGSDHSLMDQSHHTLPENSQVIMAGILPVYQQILKLSEDTVNLNLSMLDGKNNLF